MNRMIDSERLRSALDTYQREINVVLYTCGLIRRGCRRK